MFENLRELLDVLLRWTHVVAGIMWIGNSLLFNWLDRNLVRDAGANDRHLGRIWLLHSGGFYDVEKKFLAPSEMPRTLHWFKWQAYTTWMTGFLLLTLLYWTGGATLMIDPSVARLSPGAAVHIGIGVVLGSWMVYDGVWRLLGRFEEVAIGVSLALLAGLVWALTHVLSGRAAFIHVGAVLARAWRATWRCTSSPRSGSSSRRRWRASRRTRATARTPSSGRFTTTT